MIELVYADYRNFAYYLNKIDVTDELLTFYSFFEETNIMKMDLTDFFKLVCKSIDAILIDYELGHVYVLGEESC